MDKSAYEDAIDATEKAYAHLVAPKRPKGTPLRNIRISDELWAAAGKVAKATDQDISSMIRGLLVEYIGEFEDEEELRRNLAETVEMIEIAKPDEEVEPDERVKAWRIRQADFDAKLREEAKLR